MFGEIAGGEMRLSEAGRIAQEEWAQSAVIRREITLGDYVVMPNHLHGIVEISDAPSGVRAHGRAPSEGATAIQRAHSRAPRQDLTVSTGTKYRPPRSLGSFIAGFKAATSRRINALRGAPGTAVWQRNYHEHVVRDEDELLRIREYVALNPLRWELDRENPLAGPSAISPPWSS